MGFRPSLFLFLVSLRLGAIALNFPLISCDPIVDLWGRSDREKGVADFAWIGIFASAQKSVSEFRFGEMGKTVVEDDFLGQDFL